MAIVAAILYLGFSQFWIGGFGFLPVPGMEPRDLPNRWALALTTEPKDVGAFPRSTREEVGDYRLLHRLLAVMFPEGSNGVVGVLGGIRNFNPDQNYAALSSVFEKTTRQVRVVKLKDVYDEKMTSLDALLFFNYGPTGGDFRDQDIIDLYFREAASLALFRGIYLYVYLPDVSDRLDGSGKADILEPWT